MLNNEYEDINELMYQESIFKLENDNENFLILENNQYNKKNILDNDSIDDCSLNKKTKNPISFENTNYSQQNISLNEKNENELKKKNKLKRNAESARKSRLRKKKYF